jgi:hypothetical protein
MRNRNGFRSESVAKSAQSNVLHAMKQLQRILQPITRCCGYYYHHPHILSTLPIPQSITTAAPAGTSGTVTEMIQSLTPAEKCADSQH